MQKCVSLELELLKEQKNKHYSKPKNIRHEQYTSIKSVSRFFDPFDYTGTISFPPLYYEYQCYKDKNIDELVCSPPNYDEREECHLICKIRESTIWSEDQIINSRIIDPLKPNILIEFVVTEFPQVNTFLYNDIRGNTILRHAANSNIIKKLRSGFILFMGYLIAPRSLRGYDSD